MIDENSSVIAGRSPAFAFDNKHKMREAISFDQMKLQNAFRIHDDNDDAEESFRTPLRERTP